MVKLTIKHPESCPIGARPQRRVLAVIDFKQRGSGLLSSYELQQTPIPVDNDGSLVVEGAYTPSNRVLSIIAGYRTNKDEVHVFSGVVELEFVPTSFCFRLATGQYIEFYIQAYQSGPDPNLLAERS